MKQSPKSIVKKKSGKIHVKKKETKRYVPKGYVPSAAKYENFFIQKNKMIWSRVCKRKIHLEKLIHQEDHEKA